MAEITMMCETFARLANMVATDADEVEPIFSTIRVDGGQVLASNRRFLAIENIGGDAAPVHIVVDPATVAQCESEAKWNGKITFIVNEALKHIVAKTTMGYISGNLFYVGAFDDKFNRWREVINAAKFPAEYSKGGMFWDLDGLCRLAKSSPSGRVVFEENVDTARPTLVRDVSTYEWLGVFMPVSHEHNYGPATMPSWMTL